MQESELARLRRDMDVIQEAAGLGLPFGWRDVWLALSMVPCGLIILLWAAVGPWDYISISLVPLGLLFLVAVGLQFSQYHRVGRSRNLSFDWLFSGIAVLAFAVLIVWEKWLGLPARSVRGAAFIIFGAMCLVISLTNRQRRSAMAAAVALVPFGIALPLCSDQQVVIVGGIAVIVAGIVTAGILGWQLRAEGSVRERAAN